MRRNDAESLGKEPVRTLFWRLAIPGITAQLVNLLYNIVDRIYIGHLPEVGAVALTGLGVAMPILLLIISFAALIGMGGAPRASIRMGEGRWEDAQRVMGNAFVLLTGIGVASMVFFFLLKRPLLLAFGASEQTLQYADDYLGFYLLGTLFVLYSTGMNPFISAQGYARIAMGTVLLGAGVNIVLDPIFIFVLGMGVRGAAVATVIAQGISAAWVLRFLRSDRPPLRLQMNAFRLDKGIVWSIVALGFSPFIMQSTESLLQITFNTTLARYGGDLYVGVMSVLSTIMQLVFLPMMGMTGGAQPIISYNHGANQPERVMEAFRILLRSALVFTAVFYAMVRWKPMLFLRIFTDDPALMEAGARALPVFLFGMIALGVQISVQQTFVSLGKAGISVFLAVLRKLILLIPLILLLPRFISPPVNAVFMAEPIADITAAACTLTAFLLYRKKEKELRVAQQ